jgi:hypothetical protein
MALRIRRNPSTEAYSVFEAAVKHSDVEQRAAGGFIRLYDFVGWRTDSDGRETPGRTPEPFSGHMIADYIFVENEDGSDSSGDILVPITRVQVFWRCQCIPNYKKK